MYGEVGQEAPKVWISCHLQAPGDQGIAGEMGQNVQGAGRGSEVSAQGQGMGYSKSKTEVGSGFSEFWEGLLRVIF